MNILSFLSNVKKCLLAVPFLYNAQLKDPWLCFHLTIFPFPVSNALHDAFQFNVSKGQTPHLVLHSVAFRQSVVSEEASLPHSSLQLAPTPKPCKFHW